MSDKIILVSDSSCDLSPELIKEHDIRIIPLHVNFDGVEYDDGVNIDLIKMFAKVETSGNLPKTSAISPDEFVKFFTKIREEDPEAHIIYTGIGSNLSSTFQSAHLAKQIMEDDKIHLIDSQNLSTGIGLVLLTIFSSLLPKLLSECWPFSEK